MTPDPTELRLLVCTAILFRPGRLYTWFQQICCLAEIPVAHLHLHIVTDASSPEDRGRLTSILAPFLSDRFTVEIETFAAGQDPRLMPWQHKKLFDSMFLNSSRFTHLIYLEDDIRFGWGNLAYWLTYRKILGKAGFIPSFIRYEFNMTDQAFYVTDCVAPTDVRHTGLLIDGHMFVMPHNPYCAMYVVDQELGAEYRQTVSFDLEGSQTISSWPTMERSAMGPGFEHIPPGRLSRFMVRFDMERGRPDPACLVHHLPNNYANRIFPVEGYQHGLLRLADAFVR